MSLDPPHSKVIREIKGGEKYMHKKHAPTQIYISGLQPLSHVRMSATPWTVAHQAPLSTGFSRQEYWSGLPFPTPGDQANPGIKSVASALKADSLPVSHLGSTYYIYRYIDIFAILPRAQCQGEVKSMSYNTYSVTEEVSNT